MQQNKYDISIHILGSFFQRFTLSDLSERSKRLVPFAYINIWELMTSGKSFMKISKNVGPRIKAGMIPALAKNELEAYSLNTSFITAFVRNDWISYKYKRHHSP